MSVPEHERDPRYFVLSAIELLTKLLAYALATPLVVIGYWRERFKKLPESSWHNVSCNRDPCRCNAPDVPSRRKDAGLAGLHFVACLAWVVATRMLALDGCK